VQDDIVVKPFADAAVERAFAAALTYHTRRKWKG
jgi:hypothetical protein